MGTYTVEQIKQFVNESKFGWSYGHKYDISYVHNNIVYFIDDYGEEFGYTFEKLTKLVNEGKMDFYKVIKVNN